MVTFAFLGNTLFLTILVSMLSNTFSNISSNATAEIHFRRAVLTLEGVKADAVFAYQPPFNLLAVFLLLPLKFIVSPRWFHKIHVATVRLVNLPLLLIIALAERGSLGTGTTLTERWFWQRWQLSAYRYLRAVFDVPPPDDFHDDIAVDDDLTHHLIRRQYTRQETTDTEITQVDGAKKLSRRDSMFPGIPPKLRGSFTETGEDYEGIADRLDAMEQAMERMEKMLLKLMLASTPSPVDVDDTFHGMGESSTLGKGDGRTAESSLGGND